MGLFYKEQSHIIYMEVHIYLKGKKEPTIFNGDRIDILDMQLEGKDYKQIRYFRKGI